LLFGDSVYVDGNYFSGGHSDEFMYTKAQNDADSLHLAGQAVVSQQAMAAHRIIDWRSILTTRGVTQQGPVEHHYQMVSIKR